MKGNVIPFSQPTSDCCLLTAAVKNLTAENVLIETETGLVNAGLAFSCLVKPIAGDKVLVSHTGRDYYILAVLDRISGQDMGLEFPGHVQLTAPQGDITVTSGTDLNLIASGKHRMLAQKTDITSGQVSVMADKLDTRAQTMETHVQHATIYADAIDTVAKRISQRVQTVVRWVEGVETLNIGNLFQTVRQTLASRSFQTTISAQSDMMINGERIHMG